MKKFGWTKFMVVAAVFMAVLLILVCRTLAGEYSDQRHFVYFQVGKSDVDKQKIVDKLVNVKSDSILEIYGYTDQSGGADFNIKLAKERAEMIAIVIKGVMPEVYVRRIKGVPYTDDKSVNATSGEIRVYTPIVTRAQESERSVLLYAVIAVSLILLLLIWLIVTTRLGKQSRGTQTAQVTETETVYWPHDLKEIAVMFMEKLYSSEERNCPFCIEVNVLGKNYVSHLRKCATSPLFGKDANEAKQILAEAKLEVKL